jgi:mannosyltransferase OCH1-like enzyme
LFATQLIASKFPWFLSTFKSYPYGIQRADALRYFVLYEYGGIYLVSEKGRNVDACLK